MSHNRNLLEIGAIQTFHLPNKKDKLAVDLSQQKEDQPEQFNKDFNRRSHNFYKITKEGKETKCEKIIYTSLHPRNGKLYAISEDSEKQNKILLDPTRVTVVPSDVDNALLDYFKSRKQTVSRKQRTDEARKKLKAVKKNIHQGTLAVPYEYLMLKSIKNNGELVTPNSPVPTINFFRINDQKDEPRYFISTELHCIAVAEQNSNGEFFLTVRENKENKQLQSTDGEIATVAAAYEAYELKFDSNSKLTFKPLADPELTIHLNGYKPSTEDFKEGQSADKGVDNTAKIVMDHIRTLKAQALDKQAAISAEKDREKIEKNLYAFESNENSENSEISESSEEEQELLNKIKYLKTELKKSDYPWIKDDEFLESKEILELLNSMNIRLPAIKTDGDDNYDLIERIHVTYTDKQEKLAKQQELEKKVAEEKQKNQKEEENALSALAKDIENSPEYKALKEYKPGYIIRIITGIRWLLSDILSYFGINTPISKDKDREEFLDLLSKEKSQAESKSGEGQPAIEQNTTEKQLEFIATVKMVSNKLKLADENKDQKASKPPIPKALKDKAENWCEKLTVTRNPFNQWKPQATSTTEELIKKIYKEKEEDINHLLQNYKK
jgi:hypothetical protein